MLLQYILQTSVSTCTHSSPVDGATWTAPVHEWEVQKENEYIRVLNFKKNTNFKLR